MAIQVDCNLELVFTNDKLNNENFKEVFPDLDSVITKNITVQNTYFAVANVEGDKDTLTFLLVGYKDDSKQHVLTTKRYSFTPDTSSADTPNFYVQAYEYLKTLDEFAGALDC